MLRVLRHWLMARATDTALRAAPRLSVRTIERMVGVLVHCGPRCPVVARNVAENMRALGLYSPEIHRAYFAQLGAHIAGALHALRCAACGDAAIGSDELGRIAAERVELDESVTALRGAHAGRGVILIGPHIANYLLNLTRLNQEIPLTVFLRYSKDARRRVAKERWYQASGVGWISEPADAGGPLGRLGSMAAALRAGRTLFITPDLPQKRGEGMPVRFFDREIFLPPGPALLAERTGAPLFMLTAESSGPRQRLIVRGPCVVDSGGRGRENRRSAVQERVQWFTSCFAEFLRTQPALWYLWGDKRWTRLLHGDPRYARPAEGVTSRPVPGAPTDAAGVL